MSTPAPNINIEKKFIKNNQGFLYELTNIIDNENNILILTCSNTSILCHYSYEIKLGLDDFIKLNKNFCEFTNLEEIKSFISQLIENNKIQIENINNDENIKLFFNIITLNGIEEKVEIIFKKKILDTNELVGNLIEKVNNLIEENKYLKITVYQQNQKLNVLENLIYHKIDSKIIQNEKEQLLIENRLKQIPIFANKKFLTHLLFNSTYHGDRAYTFHKKCDNKNNLLFLIKTKKQLRFGGFTSVFINGIGKKIEDDDAFCFSLTLNKIYNKIKKFPESIFVHEKEIITFLKDIFKIFDNFFATQSICNDAERTIFYDNQEKEYEINGGEKTFIVEILEVFEVIFI